MKTGPNDPKAGLSAVAEAMETEEAGRPIVGPTATDPKVTGALMATDRRASDDPIETESGGPTATDLKGSATNMATGPMETVGRVMATGSDALTATGPRVATEADLMATATDRASSETGSRLVIDRTGRGTTTPRRPPTANS